MSDPAASVTIETTDPACYGVVGSDGTRYDRRGKGDGRIDLPRAEADRILHSGHPETRAYRPAYGLPDADIWDENGHLRREGARTA